MPQYVMYSSEDEGFRFPVGSPKDSMKTVMKAVDRYLKKHAFQSEGDDLPTAIKPTDKQIENSGPPCCHGKVVKMFCIDGDEYIDKLDDEDKGYAYDWLYVIKQ